MKKLKIFFSFLLSVILFSSVIVYAENITKMIQVTYRNISILVNGKQIPLDKEPFIYHGSVFAPIRTIGEAVDKSVQWDDKANQVKITDKESNFISFPLHKIGERTEMYPFAFITKKIDRKITDEKEYMMIYFEIENISDHYVEIIDYFSSLSLWNRNGTKITDLKRGPLLRQLKAHEKTNEEAFCYFEINKNNQNIPLVLVFYPQGISYASETNFNVFMAFDLGKIE
ncbi:copper amine oxidase N-terminal domain-containing protein [bacterium]|nr:copper amine oxidase N-terminal domain-containing protein [bacterium]